ncbi:MAG: hypothetical protein BWY63_01934 [Chloroflexi bacterium ADurb.Bin360]|nr:MAG: hypothetical protein BWY63_01934 [Chloroflexi bacterium ADurb.Bin360]
MAQAVEKMEGALAGESVFDGLGDCGSIVGVGERHQAVGAIQENAARVAGEGFDSLVQVENRPIAALEVNRTRNVLSKGAETRLAFAELFFCLCTAGIGKRLRQLVGDGTGKGDFVSLPLVFFAGVFD